MKLKGKIKVLLFVVLFGIMCNILPAKASISVADAFFELARQNNTQKIEQLLYRGYSIESNNEEGLNPICLAVDSGNKKAYKVLVSYGAKKKPECLSKISKTKYRHFFGVNPVKPYTPVYKSDTPYNVGTVLLGVGAVATAVALRGATSGGGGSGGDDGGAEDEKPGDEKPDGTKCPANSKYNSKTGNCECNDGYGNFGDSSNCYPELGHCENQVKGECFSCEKGFVLNKGQCVKEKECPVNSFYNPTTDTCDCNEGYGHYGDENNCYATILYCKEQDKDECKTCDGEYVKSYGVCFKKILNCKEQEGEYCIECISGYGTFNGDGKQCYRKIDNCAPNKQVEDTCTECIEGYGNHGDPYNCYEDVKNCDVYNPINLALCMECKEGFITNGDGVCYDKNFCRPYPNSVPLNNTCVCDRSKGYTGDPYDGEKGCTQAEGEGYDEGDGNRDEWSNLNDKYCNSHGVYQEKTGACVCYVGYAGADCSSCSQEQNNDGTLKYIAYDSRCYLNLKCDPKQHLVQSYDQCICDEGYFLADGRCIGVIDCGKGKEQVGASEDPEVACQCKENFVKDEETGECNCPEEDGKFRYDPITDVCAKTQSNCDEKNAEKGEKWTGEKCDICPAKYEITEDGLCGFKCAPNRLPIEENLDCESCAADYEYNDAAGTCIRVECEDGVNGYIKENGICTCDEANGYSYNLLGECELKKESYIGIKDSNINNSKITLNNYEMHRDVYGMRPVKEIEYDEDGNVVNEIFYDSIYNSLNYDGAEININNEKTGSNTIYGMYSQSMIYNAATTDASQDTSSTGLITIKDANATSKIYGIKSDGINNVYNSFSINSNTEGSNNQSNGSIEITKEDTSSGSITGISGYNDIYNAYSRTEGGVGANTRAIGNINIEHKGTGSVVGIDNTSVSGRTSNAYAFLDSAVSDSIAEGNITVEGNNDIYGIKASAIVVNSETQLKKKYNIINNFGSTGTINVTGHSKASGEGAFGIFSPQNSGVKADIYNAMGYNAQGIINVTNDEGGSVYGIYSQNEKYKELDEKGEPVKDEDGAISFLYNTVYNAFRSSSLYGGENVEAKGEINLFIEGGNENPQAAIGMYALGDAINSYVNSGSDVKLESIAEINISDQSSTSEMNIKGIEAGADTIANAFARGQGKNTTSLSKGTIRIVKNGSSNSSVISGIYNATPNYSKGVSIYNAALIDDKSTVEGTIKIEANNNPGKIYGIYAKKGAEDGQIKTIYNAYYDNNIEQLEGEEYSGKVTGIIDIDSKVPTGGYTETYGIYAEDSIAYNTYISAPDDANITADVKGTISVKSAGGGMAGIAVGMYGSGINSALYNTTQNSVINVEANNDGKNFFLDIYGMKVHGGYAENGGTINAQITNKGNLSSNAYGIFVENGVAKNNETGVINVFGNTQNYGIKVNATKNSAVTSKVYNYGEINVGGGALNYGIYANIDEGSLAQIEVENHKNINITGTGTGIFASGPGVTITNLGTITITPTEEGQEKVECTGNDCGKNSAAIVLNGATFKEMGDIVADDDIDLTSFGGNVVLGSTGSFNVKGSLSGDLSVDNAVIEDTFDTTTVVKDAIVATNTDNLNLSSNSHLYNASLKENNNSSYDVEMKLKDFNDVTSNNLATYYAKNYALQTNSALFNALKQAQNQREFSSAEGNITGNNVLPNQIEEELKISRSLDSKMMKELFVEDKSDIRRMVGGDNLYIGRENQPSLTGYELNAQSMYALYDKKLDNNHRLGLGLSFTNSNTNYDNDGSRKNFSVQGYVPYTYNILNGVTAVTMARIGYQDGEYTRYGYNKHSYKADENAFTYGLLNEVQYKMNLGSLSLTPFIGLNALGWYYDSIDEQGDELALSLASSHVFSLESALGLYLDYEKKINDNSKLSTSLGLAYYHEFSNPYSKRRAKINNTHSSYKLNNSSLDSKDRGVISAKINYDYKDMSVYGEFMQYLEKEYPFSLDLGLRYKF